MKAVSTLAFLKLLDRYCRLHKPANYDIHSSTCFAPFPLHFGMIQFSNTAQSARRISPQYENDRFDVLYGPACGGPRSDEELSISSDSVTRVMS